MFKMREKIYPDEGNEASEEKYQAYLQKNKRAIQTELFDWFHEDYFHDGVLTKIDYDINNSLLNLSLGCPNFINSQKEYVYIDFNLTFRSISYFKLNWYFSKKNVRKAKQLENSTFMHGELGTLVPPKENQSLIMLFIPEKGLYQNFYTSFIFKEAHIEPQEPLMFKHLIDTKQIHLE